MRFPITPSFFLVVCFILSGFIIAADVQAQSNTQIGAYHRGIDEINCATVKTMLNCFSRQSNAKNLTTCTYGQITAELQKVKTKEQTIKGYSDEFLKFAEALNNFKTAKMPTNADQADEYLREARGTALQNINRICNTFKNNEAGTLVCENLQIKTTDLEGKLNNIISTALAKWNGTTDAKGDRANESPEKTSPTTTTPTDYVVPGSESKNANGDTAEANKETKTGGGFWSKFLNFIFFAALLLSLVFLYRENLHRKSEIQALKEALRMFINP
ncbi:MAG: hypothetical protein OT643_05335, partial [Bacteroidetes bacterium]|nr:hypothetical protein [Bacteroidota bacterium]